MKKLLFICVALSFFVIGCDDDTSINAPESIVGNSYYRHFDSREALMVTGGYFQDKIQSLDMTYYFSSKHSVRLYVEYKVKNGAYYYDRQASAYADYEYNPRNGKITIEYEKSFMGVDTDSGYVSENTLKLGAGVYKWSFKRKRNN